MNVTPIRLLLCFVGLTLLVATGGVILLALNEQAVPDVLQNIAVGALTGLVGLLVPSSGRSE